jgi:hypothetical protein
LSYIVKFYIILNIELFDDLADLRIHIADTGIVGVPRLSVKLIGRLAFPGKGVAIELIGWAAGARQILGLVSVRRVQEQKKTGGKKQGLFYHGVLLIGCFRCMY